MRRPSRTIPGTQASAITSISTSTSFGQPRHFDSRPRWRRLLEIAAVNFVHGIEISHVLEEDGAAQNFLQAAARGLQNGGQILYHALSLRAHIAGDDLRVAGSMATLSRSKDQTQGSNRLRVGADRLRRLSVAITSRMFPPVQEWLCSYEWRK
jgi:hypothetical protein